MISWLEVTRAPFEYTESFSQSASGRTTYSDSFSVVTGDVLIIGSLVTAYSSFQSEGSTSNETSSSSYLVSYRTINAEGTAASLESGSTYFLSIFETSLYTEAASFDDTVTTSVGTGTNSSSTTTITQGANTNATSESNENTSEETETTSLTATSFVPATASPETSTTTTQEYYPSITTETTRSFSFLTTASQSTTSISITQTATASTWTTATSTSSTTTIGVSETTSTIEIDAVTTLNETQTGNAFNTIYQAGASEIFYVAGDIPISEWDGSGRTAEATTRTTLFHKYAVEGVYASSTGAEVSFATNSAITSSISWSDLDFSETTITSAFLFVLPHSTFTQPSFAFTTSSASHLFSSDEQIVEYNATTKSVEYTYAGTTTAQRYFGSFSYQEAVSTASTSTKIEGIQAAGITYENSSETSSFGGDTTVAVNTIALGVRIPAAAPTWEVFVSRGAADENNVGLFYTFTGSGLSEVRQASASRAIQTIFPATNATYTADATGLTWRPFTSESSLTTSGSIEAGGTAELEIVSSRSFVVGGNLADGEIANELFQQGLYRNGSGGTEWRNDVHISYSGERPTSWLSPKYWLGIGGLPIRTAARNDTALPSIVPQAF